MSFVDLHLHTHHSDGSDSPDIVVTRAIEAGATAIALTDHDTVAGVAAGQLAASEAGLGFLTGTEISAWHKGREIHVLGYGISIQNGSLLEGLAGLCQARRSRGEEIVGRLEALGYHLPDALAGDGREAIGRMHIAQAMTAVGYVKKPQEAFDRYLNAGKPAFVPKQAMPIAEAIALIHGAGGLAFVAHPGLGKTVRRLLPELFTLPFDGLEAYHVSHSPGRVEEFIAFAHNHQALISGGSDCHGSIKGKPLLGQVQTPVAVYDAIVDRLGARRQSSRHGNLRTSACSPREDRRRG